MAKLKLNSLILSGGNITIVSDGKSNGTTIMKDGEVLNNVVSYTIKHKAGELAKITIEVTP